MRAVRLASSNAQQAKTMVMTETLTMRGLSSLGANSSGLPTGGTVTVSVNMSMEQGPTTRMQMGIRINEAGHVVNLNEIITPQAIYTKQPSVPGLKRGKPWFMLDLDNIKGRTNVAKLFRQAQENDPMASLASPQSLTALARLGAHFRWDGIQSVDGVQTTKYAGTIPLGGFLDAMSAVEQGMSNSVPSARLRSGQPFEVWIDGQHQMRKLIVRMAYGHASMVVQANVVAINRPVHIVVPPPSQVTSDDSF
jgi:hypothetical protein